MIGFKPGDRVRHHTGAEGTVTRANGNFATVEWDTYVRANTHHIDLLTPLGEPMSNTPDVFDAFAQPGSHNPETKAFKSVADGSNATFLVIRSGAGIGLAVNSTMSVIDLAPEDAPAIALAFLEAAGVEPIDHSNVGCTDGSPEALEEITFWLTGYVTESAKVAKEKAERESLEADALKLYIGYAGGKAAPKTFAKMDAQMQWRFMAVARAARELHGVTA